MSVKTSAKADPKATQRVRLADAHEPVPFPERAVDARTTRPLEEGTPGSEDVSVPEAQVTQQVGTPNVLVLRPSDAARETQPVVQAPGPNARADSGDTRLKTRPRFWQWVARRKRALVLSGVLIAVSILAIVFATTQGDRAIQRAAVGSGGLQMRAASLAQADLQGRDLKWADLSQADLRQANLSNANMIGADLSGAGLEEANLENAILRGADLSGAKLKRAVLARTDLHWAVLRNADLTESDLREADLQGADLENASLEGANLTGANLKTVHLLGTTLPDGTRWTPRSNLRRFTDPTYPDFWRPPDAQSLAFR